MRIHIIPAALLSLLLAACGGSSGKSGSNSSIPVTPAPGASSVSSITASSVQSSDSSVEVIPGSSSQASSVSSALPPVMTGIFVDGAVENIGYRTETLSGVTNEAGEYSYREGEWVTFFIGELELPSVAAGDIITPLNIADTDDINDVVVINIARLLQSLDVDGNPANGIRISSAIADQARLLDFSLPVDVFAGQPEVLELLSANGGVYTSMVSTESALSHLGETLAFINEPSSSSSAISQSSVSSSVSSTTTGGGAQSSVSSNISTSSSASDAGNDIRPAKMEGFAAHAGVTGGQGGAVVTVSTGTELNAALCSRASMSTPIVIMVNGTINHGNTTKQGCNTADNVIEIKKMSNLSIIGVGTNALFDELGIHMREASNIIIQNVHVRNVKKSGSPQSNGGDAIGMESGVDRVWIDHNKLEASGGEKDGYDSLLDMKSGVTNVTVSYNVFNDSSRAGLVGYTDSDDKNGNITFHHNWYKNIEQRTPLIRNSLVHVYNNYWSNERIDYMFHAINSRANAKVLVESNYFYNVNNPLIASSDSPTPGCWQTNNENTVLPEIYYSRSVGNGALVVPEVIDGQLQSTCAVTVPYTVELDHSSDVPAIVMANAGIGKTDNGSGAPGSSSSSVSSSSAGNPASSASSSSSTSEAASSATGEAEIIFSENFEGATAANFYSTYRVNSNGQPLYKKSGGNPAFENGSISLTGARFTIGETGKDLDLSKPYTLSFDIVAASGSGKVQIFVDNASTSGDRIFNENANTLVVGQRLVLHSTEGTANSFIQIRAESNTTLALDNLVIEHTGAAGSSSSSSSTGGVGSSSSSSSVSSNSSSSSSSVVSSSSSSVVQPSIPPGTGGLTTACYQLATDPNTNWRETSLQTDQEIVKCLSDSLGKPVGYGENARGGYDPDGNSKLTVIVKNHPDGKTVEEQIRDAVTGEDYNWIVFDKVDFAQTYEIGLYRLHCSNPALQNLLGATEETCVDYYQWCADKGFDDHKTCMSEFFNKALNKKALQDVAELKSVRNLVVGSNKTLDGRMSEAYFRFSGFAIGRDNTGSPTQTANSVIFTHLSFQGAGHTEDHYYDPDMIRSTGASSDIWIHKNTFDTTGDSAFDVKVGAHNITMSFNEVVDVLRATLHSSSDSHTIDAQITTTMHHNAFVTRDAGYMTLGNTGRRVPLIRRGTSHMFNNVFVNYRKDILSIRVGAQVLWEDNMIAVNRVHQEKSNVENALNELVANMIRDVNGGNYRGEGIYLWFSDAACNLDDATQRQLTVSSGSVGDLNLAYTPASQAVIAEQRIGAGQDLVDYVSATAGKHGQLPFNSPLAGNRSYVLGLGKVGCQ